MAAEWLELLRVQPQKNLTSEGKGGEEFGDQGLKQTVS